MGKLVSDDVLDAALNVIKTATLANVCEASTNTFAKATLSKSSGSGQRLANVVIDGSNFTGPASGSGGGRKLTNLVSDTSDMKSISVDQAGAAAEVALTLAAGSKLFYVTTLASVKSLGASDKVTLGTFVVTIADPT